MHYANLREQADLIAQELNGIVLPFVRGGVVTTWGASNNIAASYPFGTSGEDVVYVGRCIFTADGFSFKTTNTTVPPQYLASIGQYTESEHPRYPDIQAPYNVSQFWVPLGEAFDLVGSRLYVQSVQPLDSKLIQRSDGVPINVFGPSSVRYSFIGFKIRLT
jgi:hypothetical protein